MTAVDYLYFNEALQKTFNNGADGIVDYMKKHMSHLIRLPVVTEQEALSDHDRPHRNQHLSQDLGEPAHDVNGQGTTPSPSETSWSVIGSQTNGGTTSAVTGMPTPLHPACAISPAQEKAAHSPTFQVCKDV